MHWFDLSLQLPITDPTWVFFLVLIIILFAPMILGRLHIPHIIGMILAGVVIGEYGFNVLERDSSFELFGKVGLYYIMFLAGLEMHGLGADGQRASVGRLQQVHAAQQGTLAAAGGADQSGDAARGHRQPHPFQHALPRKLFLDATQADHRATSRVSL